MGRICRDLKLRKSYCSELKPTQYSIHQNRSTELTEYFSKMGFIHIPAELVNMKFKRLEYRRRFPEIKGQQFGP